MNLARGSITYKIILLVAIGMVLFPQLPGNTQERRNSQPRSFATSFKPPNKDAPVATSGGASRGTQCIVDVDNSKVPIIPIIPAINQRLTVASHPTFFIHIPKTSAKQIFLKIEDENEEDTYQTILPISGETGILQVSIPEEAPPLEVGKNYKWALALMCADTLEPDSPIVQGSITRVNTTIESNTQWSTMTQIEQANFYAESGIWYESIEILAELRQEEPNNTRLLAIWQEILDSIGLNAIAKADFVR